VNDETCFDCSHFQECAADFNMGLDVECFGFYKQNNSKIRTANRQYWTMLTGREQRQNIWEEEEEEFAGDDGQILLREVL